MNYSHSYPNTRKPGGLSVRRGQAVVPMIVGLVVVLVFAGLAIDGGNLYTQRRRGQNAVDAAALGAARILSSRDRDLVVSIATELMKENGYVDGEGGVSLQINRPPSVEPYASLPNNGGDDYIEIVLTAPVDTAFIHLAYTGPVEYTVRAISYGAVTHIPFSGAAMVSLGRCTSSKTGVDGNGGGNSGGITTDGDIVLNKPVTDGDDCALEGPNSAGADGITTDSDSKIYSVGSYDYNGETGVNSPVVSGYNNGNELVNPMAFVPTPVCSGNASWSTSGGVTTYTPGSIDGSNFDGDMWLEPGIYCVHSSDIRLSTHDILRGDGVMLYLDGVGIQNAGQGAMEVTAPRGSNCTGTYGNPTDSCNYVGMVIFSSLGNTSDISIGGNGGTATVGTIYARDGTVETVGGGASPGETVVIGQIIAGYITNSGNGSLIVIYREDLVYQVPPTIQMIQN